MKLFNIFKNFKKSFFLLAVLFAGFISSLNVFDTQAMMVPNTGVAPTSQTADSAGAKSSNTPAVIIVGVIIIVGTIFILWRQKSRRANSAVDRKTNSEKTNSKSKRSSANSGSKSKANLKNKTRRKK